MFQINKKFASKMQRKYQKNNFRIASVDKT